MTVTDSNENPVSGIVLTFTAPSTYASGVFTGSGTNTTTATTDINGVATTTTFTANSMLGAYQIVVTSGSLTAVNFDLRNSSSVSVLSGLSITNTGGTTVSGDVDSADTITGSAGIAFTGTGALHTNNDTAVQAARSDALALYSAATGSTCDTDLSGKILGTNVGTSSAPLTPGVYCFSAAAQLTGTLYLNGGPTDFFIFKIGTALTTEAGASEAPGSSVVFSDGVTSNNVIWAVGSAATIGTYSAFKGDNRCKYRSHNYWYWGIINRKSLGIDCSCYT